MKLSRIALACLVATSTMVPQIAVADDSLEFHGYGRWGVMYEADGNLGVAANGQTSNAAGRMGNEGFGAEFMLQKKFESENGSNWDLGVMIEDWYEIGLKQFYAGGSNVFESQPNAYLWAGRVFHSRVSQDLNDFFLVTTDSQGVGVKSLDLGFANLELGAVGGMKQGTYGKAGQGSDKVTDIDGNEIDVVTPNTDPDGKGNYAITSKLSDISMGPVSMDLLLNYGFSDHSIKTEDAFIGLVKLSGWNQNFYARYSENTDGGGNKHANVLARSDDTEVTYLSLDGSFSLGENTGLNYLTSYTDSKDVSKAYNVIVRVAQQWNDTHSTWVEAGYSDVDIDGQAKHNTASKITLQHNLAISGVPWARPMVKLFATVGTSENYNEDADTMDTVDPLIVGALFEAWW